MHHSINSEGEVDRFIMERPARGDCADRLSVSSVFDGLSVMYALSLRAIQVSNVLLCMNCLPVRLLSFNRPWSSTGNTILLPQLGHLHDCSVAHS